MVYTVNDPSNESGREDAPTSYYKMSKRLRGRLEGVQRVLGMREWPGVNTRQALLELSNRAIGRDYTLTRDDVTHIGNGSTIIMWLESQVRVAEQIISEVLDDAQNARSTDLSEVQRSGGKQPIPLTQAKER